MGVWGWAGCVVGAVAVYVAVVVALGVRRGWREAQLPDCAALDYVARYLQSGVWRLTPPCGYDTWDLWAPGSPRDAGGFLLGDPAATFDANTGPGKQRFDGSERLADIESWLRPWIEEVTGRRVLHLCEGVAANVGPDDGVREWAVFAVVENDYGVTVEVSESAGGEGSGR